jgi:hypothetical protein
MTKQSTLPARDEPASPFSVTHGPQNHGWVLPKPANDGKIHLTRAVIRRMSAK